MNPVKTIAHSVVMKEEGLLPYRVVCRAFYDAEGHVYQFVNHYQRLQDGIIVYDTGGYFNVTSPEEEIVQNQKALEDFVGRFRKSASRHPQASAEITRQFEEAVGKE